jgi:putative glutamine amidotransferase
MLLSNLHSRVPVHDSNHKSPFDKMDREPSLQPEEEITLCRLRYPKVRQGYPCRQMLRETRCQRRPGRLPAEPPVGARCQHARIKMKPIVGINTDIREALPRLAQVQTEYIQAIEQAGGIPLLIPPMSDESLAELLGRINGLMLIGGADYSPAHYEEEPHPKASLVSACRDEFDLRLVTRALERAELPMLGICAGCQILNLGLGGSLIQDIPSQLKDSKVEHSSPDGWHDGWNQHQVKITTGSRLSRIYPQLTLSVPTSHHQSIKQVAEGLQATAYADDGVVEAVEHNKRAFAIGVQWHPERDFPTNRVLFEEFIRQSAAVACGST